VYDQLNSGYEWACHLTCRSGLLGVEYFHTLNEAGTDLFVDSGIDDLKNWNLGLGDILPEQVRQAMLLASGYSGSQWYNDNMFWRLDRPACTRRIPLSAERHYLRVWPIAIHKSHLYLWGASLAITFFFVLGIPPAFWGFWVLVRKPMMSPVDVGRGFNAPILNEAEYQNLNTSALLQRVGGKSFHHDLVYTRCPV
jgi:hypothetical protein